MKLPRPRRCFCMTLRRGSSLIAVFWMIMAGFGVGQTAYQLRGSQEMADILLWYFAFNFMIDLLMLAVTVVMLLGVAEDRHPYLVPWLAYSICYFVFILVTSIWFIVSIHTGQFETNTKYDQMKVGCYVMIITIVLSLYMYTVVFSLYTELKILSLKDQYPSMYLDETMGEDEGAPGSPTQHRGSDSVYTTPVISCVTPINNHVFSDRADSSYILPDDTYDVTLPGYASTGSISNLSSMSYDSAKSGGLHR